MGRMFVCVVYWVALCICIRVYLYVLSFRATVYVCIIQYEVLRNGTNVYISESHSALHVGECLGICVIHILLLYFFPEEIVVGYFEEHK